MSKVQPNFSWQAYEGEQEQREEQFQFQLQQEHIVVANAINTTIDDLSFFLKERVTGFIWVTGQPIYTQTYATVAWTTGGTVNAIPLGIVGNFTIIQMVCDISDGALSTSNTLQMPHLDVTNAANDVSIVRNGETVTLTSGGTDRSAYSGYLTIYYTKN